MHTRRTGYKLKPNRTKNKEITHRERYITHRQSRTKTIYRLLLFENLKTTTKQFKNFKITEKKTNQ